MGSGDTRPARSARSDRRAIPWTVGVAPLLLLAGIAVWYVSDRLVIVGPFDRAQIGWAAVVPLLALAPGTAGLAGRQADRAGSARFAIVALSVASGLFVLVGLAATILYLDCRPVAGPLDVVPRALPTALVAGSAFAIAASVAATLRRDRPALISLLGGAVVWIVAATVGLFVFAASFPALSCAPPSS